MTSSATQLSSHVEPDVVKHITETDTDLKARTAIVCEFKAGNKSQMRHEIVSWDRERRFTQNRGTLHERETNGWRASQK